MALLTKWWWRMMMENSALWAKVIQSIHGLSCRDPISIAGAKKPGVWLNIVKVGAACRKLNLNIEEFFRRAVGKGDNISLWNDSWCSASSLSHLFPDLFALETNKECSIASRFNLNSSHSNKWAWSWSPAQGCVNVTGRIKELEHCLNDVILTDKEDSWRWIGDSGGMFSVKAWRLIIDNVQNSPFAGVCFWNNWLPRRVNCFVWRLLLNRLPTKSSLCKRGISLPSVECPLCNNMEECAEHLFYGCAVVQVVWKWLFNWCGVSINMNHSLEHLLFELKEIGSSTNRKKFMEAAFGSIVWFVWKSRNNLLFNGKRFSAQWVMDEVQASLFSWLKYRSKCTSIVWATWCCNPLSTL